ncbi:HPF/RaiA family ribosome-associated protein [Amycolatopsis sp. NPDC054798]
MQVEISTDNNVPGSAGLSRRIEEELRTALSRFSDHLTRLEAHLSDEVSAGATGVDRRCVLEARPEGKPAVVVSHFAGSVDEALRGATRKLEGILERQHDQAAHHKGGDTVRYGRSADQG